MKSFYSKGKILWKARASKSGCFGRNGKHKELLQHMEETSSRNGKHKKLLQLTVPVSQDWHSLAAGEERRGVTL